ncbi:type I-F CRISPR-associated protein Csy1 [Marinomonas algicola]|uniref:type I-F CRISPR-associated protein Csy1 n=1 Tax=Marinomonas algicola TaxID=2773454 RepID=UPI00174AB5F1|nr:type I-F CRISPR-associated protein Csy1 [Marinomonas algicola]
MVDDFKKHIDKLIKRKLKDKKYEFDYSSWLITLVEQEMEAIHPQSEFHWELFEVLSFDVLYKQSFKSLCDSGHPVARESLEKLGINDSEINLIINSVESVDNLFIEYCELFKDELLNKDNSLNEVHKKITELSLDCSQGTIISHSPKMTNPSCKYPRLNITASNSPDGFVRSGNSPVDFDMHINATKLKVFKFLSLKINGISLLELINDKNINVISSVFLANERLVNDWVLNFNSGLNEQDLRTHFAIKQIYFPVEKDYHQLSILSPSGLVFSLKNKIDHINDRSKEAYLGKKARKENQYVISGFSTIVNLTVTRHGGDHPKNISGLNNKYQSYYLLSSSPPAIKTRDLHFPRTDFFVQTVNYFQCKHAFHQLHTLYSRDDNNMHIRAERDEYYQSVVDHIIEKMWQVRSVALEQYIPTASQLSTAQKTWLCQQDEGKVLRETADDWLDEIIQSVSTFVFHGYEKILGKKAIKLGYAEHKHMQQIVIKNKEALR